MKKKTIKIVAFIALVVVLAVLVPTRIAVAGDETLEISDHGTVIYDGSEDFGSRSSGANGVMLIADKVYGNNPLGEVHVLIDNSDMENELAGVSMELNFENATVTGKIRVNSTRWTISEYNTDNDNTTIRFLVEKTELYAEEVPNPEIAIQFSMEEDSAEAGVWINKATFAKTDIYNNVYHSLEGISDVPLDFSAIIERDETNLIESEDEDSIHINGNLIQVKFEGTTLPDQPGYMINILELFDNLRINGNWNSITVRSGESSRGCPNLGVDLDTMNFGTKDFLPADNGMSLLLNVTNSAGTYTVYEYDIVEMGNTYYEDVYVGGIININDVTWLRQAIVGQEEALEDPYFHAEASDVNFSNTDGEMLGDIGDVISIRQRILNYYWLDK